MTERLPALRILLLLLAVTVLLQLPLILNPGYYNHDELQWASWSVGRAWSEVGWARLGDWDTFQYRPLTFNVWMQLSRWFFETPYLMHAACVAIGTLNALLLWTWMRQLGVAKRTAFIASLVWVLNPYAMHTHGWVGTLADTLWVLFALIAITSVQRIADSTLRAHNKQIYALLLSLLLTTLALLSKEAALVLPAAFLVAAYRPQYRATQIAALVGSSIAVALYLALRLQPILAGAESSSAYSLANAAPFTRWLEYLIFPSVLERAEPLALLQQTFGLREWGSVLLVSLVTIAVWLRSWRLGLLWLLAPLAALVPVLPLPASLGHYAYAASAVGCVVLAVAAMNLGKFGKWALIVWLIVMSFHGLQIADKMRDAGVIQYALAADVNRLRTQQPDLKLRIRAEHLKQQPLLRTLFSVPSYNQVPWGDAVVPVNQDNPSANFQMDRNGHLEPWPKIYAENEKQRRKGPPD